MEPDAAADAAPDIVEFECPRCHRPARARFYGPCPECSAQLQDAYRTEQRDVEAPEYEPKMNVTPNAVATKD